jgi:hypothetical protein
VTATRLADVGVRDSQPLVLSGGGEHLAQLLAVAFLELVAVVQGDAGVGDPSRQSIAYPLQLAKAGDSRRAGESRDAGVDVKARECLGREAGQLTLEAPDLPPQLGARQPLVVDLERNRLSFEQLKHEANRV